MAERKVVDCDRCGKRDCKDTGRIVVSTGTLPCPVEGSTVNWETFDLCPVCLTAELGTIVEHRSFNGKDWASRIKAIHDNG